MISRAKLVRIAHWTLTCYIAFIGIALILQVTLVHSEFMGWAVFFSVAFLAPVIPLFFFVLPLVNFGCKWKHSAEQRVKMFAARILFLLVWMPAFAAAMLYVATEPWPISLRQGPDTGYARSGFREHIGYSALSSVSELYYKADDLGIDSRYQLRFKTSDAELVDRIVERSQLSESVDKGSTSSYHAGPGPEWWEAESEKRKNARSYSRGAGTNNRYWHLWYDESTGLVWYLWGSR